ncbi:MAG: gamma-glutamyl-gamma-aminobutyrate hydrolase family protein [bacterium]
MTHRALVVEHDHVSPPGPVGEALAGRGYDISELLVVPEEHFARPGVKAVFPPATQFDVIVAMGAPWSAYDRDAIGSWLAPEEELLRDADACGVPVLGICFGGQLLAQAHGGEVRRAGRPEFGWVEVATDRPELIETGPWFQWHYDGWRLPPGAEELARTPAASQAFRLRRNLAVQFHPELNTSMLTGWLDNGGAVALAEAGVDVDALVQRTRATELAARERATRLVQRFLDTVAVS